MPIAYTAEHKKYLLQKKKNLLLVFWADNQTSLLKEIKVILDTGDSLEKKQWELERLSLEFGFDRKKKCLP
jgi:hypothetical protein